MCLMLALAGYSAHAWNDDGKCHPLFLECVSFCDYTCSHSPDLEHIPMIAEKANILNTNAGLKLADCSMNDDFDRRLQLPIIVQAIKFIHESFDYTDSRFAGTTSRFKEYGTLGKSFPGLFSWSCTEHCEYECMHHIATTMTVPVKFFGKWPFRRIAICQEFLSSLYSLLNAVPYAYLFVHKRFRQSGRRSIKFYAILATILWIASAMFHCRDNRATMLFDYFSAFAGVVGNLWLAVYLTVPPDRRSIVNLLALGLWSSHVGYMALIEFNFEWNMTLAAALAFLANSAWTVWYMTNRYGGRKHRRLVLVATWILVPLFLLMEANDFPPGPLGLADAHSYWHLSTIPVSVLWALFFYREALYKLSAK